MKRNYFSLLPEFIIAGNIIYSYVHRLWLLSQGEKLHNVTGMDTFVVELISAVFCLILISLIFVIARAKHEDKFKTVGNFVLWLLCVSVIVLFLKLGLGNMPFDIVFLYILAGSTLLKLWIFWKNKMDFFKPIAYVFIFGGCLMVTFMIELYIFDFATLSPHYKNLTILEMSMFTDIVAAIIFYFVIGFIIPIMTIFWKVRNKR